MTTRHTNRRAAALLEKLSERDLAVLSSLERLRLLTSGQLQRLHMFAGSTATRPRRTRALLKRLYDLQLITRFTRTIGGIRAGSTGHVYGLSGLGQAVLGIQGTYNKRRRSVWETKPYFQDHVLTVAELYVRTVEATREGNGDLLTFDAEPACWRTYIGSDGDRQIVKPDAFVRTGVGEIERSTFVEVDLASEGPGTIKRKCQAFISYWRSGVEQEKHGVFPKVLWLVPTEQRRERLADIVRHLVLEAQALFSVACFRDGVQLLTAPESGSV
jgi:hypothetical protein